MSHLSRFTCEEAFRRLDDYLDRELSPDEMELVRMHLEICAGCAQEFNFEASTLRNVSTKMRQLDMPADLLERTLEALRREKRPGGSGRLADEPN
jgi:anti-sigma factor (TIGR02949 family)